MAVSRASVPKGYIAVESLGNGNFGEVTLARRTSDGNLVVIKKLNKEKEHQKILIQNELEAGKRLVHENLVQLLDFVDEEESCFLILNYVKGECLFDWLNKRSFNPLPEDQVKKMFKGLAKGLAHSHKKGIAHLDLKIDNVIITQESKMIILDFGLCSVHLQNASKRWVGSGDYAAPEILLRNPYQETKADIWSLGTILHILLSGEIPFDRKMRFESLQLGEHPNFKSDSEALKGISKEGRDLLSKMMQSDPSKRPEMKDLLFHPWFKSGFSLSQKFGSILTRKRSSSTKS
eukprot:TRINITY_DN1897_c0_g1_i1.p1 TRINITY_DN1897_c0_g1~~TRINITY_DN1897_c0_g1_i1.p1  ORF type:complete len:291 (-),score=97.03 TRINITY_DN1897_c0_g1_i1:168-1040(-)